MDYGYRREMVALAIRTALDAALSEYAEPATWDEWTTAADEVGSRLNSDEHNIVAATLAALPVGPKRDTLYVRLGVELAHNGVAQRDLARGQ